MAIGREDWRLLCDVPKDRRPWPYHQWSQPDVSWKLACWGWGHPMVGYAVGTCGTIFIIAFGLVAAADGDGAFAVLWTVWGIGILAMNVGISEIGIGGLAKRWAARGSNPAPWD